MNTPTTIVRSEEVSPNRVSSWFRRPGYLLILLVAAVILAAGGLWVMLSSKETGVEFRTAAVRRADLVATISATGTIEPEAAVDIGAQVAGVIVAFGKDKNGKSIDWGSVVDVGTVLARIDDSLYVTAVKTAEGQVDQYTGQLQRDQALLEEARLDLARYQKLSEKNSIARQQAEDQAYVVRQDEGTVELDKGLLEGAKASLLTAKVNLGYCTIRSPVKGVVIDRRVNIGQTVVSSLSAPSLFLIANDLRRIQLWVSVNEADVGSIAAGQPVTFTVDAFPGRTFRGRVGQVRLNATMTQNVVTYTIEVDIDNSDGTLLPYLTANAQFEIGHRKDVLLVPNAALHWTPRPDQIAPEPRAKSREQPSPRERGPSEATASANVWLVTGSKFVRPVPVRTGLTDGAFTEVAGEGLSEGLQVVIREGGPEVTAAGTAERNPFAPQIFRGQPAQQGPTAGSPGQPAPASGSGR